MIMIIVAVRDAKAEAFTRPWYAQKAGSAIRVFSDEVNRKDPDNPMYNHPADYALYEIGSFDDNNGQITPLDVPKLLIQADQVTNGTVR